MNLLCKLLPFGLFCATPEGPADLAAYAGKSPFENVEEARLLDVPRVRKSIALYGGDQLLLDTFDAGTTIELRDGALVVGLCDKGACENANAGLALARDGGVIALCTFEKPGPAKWSGPLLKKRQSPEPCPQDADSFINAYTMMRE